MGTYLERATIWTNDPLSPFHESLLIPHDVTNLDNVACNVVVQDLHSLPNRYASRKELDHISSFEDDIWVVCFTCCSYGHGTVNQVERAGNPLASRKHGIRRNEQHSK